MPKALINGLLLCLLLPSLGFAEGPTDAPADRGWQLIGPGGGGRITSIAEDPSNPSNLYLTINVGGARRSRDGGKTWELMNRGFDYARLGKDAQQMMSLAVHPADSRAILAAGLNGDLYAWDDVSQAWRLSYRHPQAEGAREFAFARFTFHPKDPNTVYVSVGNLQKLLLGVGARRAGAFWPPITEGPTVLRGVWNTETRAWTWSPVGELCPGNGRGGGRCLNIYALDLNPQNPDELFAMTERGLYVGGMEPDGAIKAWTPLTAGLPPSEFIHGGKIVFDRSSPGVAYLTILNLKDARWHGEAAGGVFKSEDGGRSWVKLRGGLDLAHANYFDVQIDPKDAQTLYVAQFTNEAAPEGRVEGTLYRSTDGGRRWTSIVDPGRLEQGWIAEVEQRPKRGPDFVSVSAHSRAVRWSVGGGILFEGDGRAERPVWRNLLTKRMSAGPEGAARWTTTGSEAIALSKSIAVDPTDSDVLYLPCGDHAYFKSEDGGRTVQALTNFPDIKAAGNAADSGTFLVDARQPAVLYAATEGPHQQYVDGGVMYSNDRGKTWTVVGGHTHARRGTLPRGGMTDLLVEYTQAGARNLYVANHGNAKGQGSGVYVLHDVLTGPAKKKNKQWKRLLAPKSRGAVRSLAARDGFQTVFVGVDNEGLYKLQRDKRGAWRIAKGPIALGDSTTFYDLDTAPKSQTIYAATDAGLFTIDREDRIARVAIPAFAGLAQPMVRAVESHPKDERILYVASEKTDVLRSADGGRAWEPISQGIPTLGLVTLQVDPNRDTIYAAGPGTGVWKRRFDPAPPTQEARPRVAPAPSSSPSPSDPIPPGQRPP